MMYPLVRDLASDGILVTAGRLLPGARFPTQASYKWRQVTVT